MGLINKLRAMRKDGGIHRLFLNNVYFKKSFRSPFHIPHLPRPLWILCGIPKQPFSFWRILLMIFKMLHLRSMPYSLLVTGGNPAVCDSHLPADNYGCRSRWTFHPLWNVPDTADTGRNLFSGIPCSLAVPMYHYPLVSDLRKRPPRSLFQLKMIRSKQKRHNYSIFDKFFNFFLKRFLLV